MRKALKKIVALITMIAVLASFAQPVMAVEKQNAPTDKSFLIQPEAPKADAALLDRVNSLLTDFEPDCVEETLSAGALTFTHPGIGMSKKMLDNMQQNVRAGNEPWASAFIQLSEDYYAELPGGGWAVSKGYCAPYTDMSQRKASKTPKIFVNPDNPSMMEIGTGQQTWGHYAVFSILHDGDTAMSQSIMYYITGDEVYRQNAMKIIRGWSQLRSSAGPFDVQIRVSLGVYQMAFAADLLKQTPCEDPASPLNWTAADTAGFSSFLNILKPYYNRDYHFMNQHDFCVMATTAAGIFLNDQNLYAAGIERTTTNDSRCTQSACRAAGGHCLVAACDLNRTGSIKYQIRAMGKNDRTGSALETPNIQVVEMGRDQRHAWCDVGGMGQVAMMSLCQGTAVDPVTGAVTLSENAVNVFNFLDDRLLYGANYMAKYNLGGDVTYIPCYNNEQSTGAIWDTINNGGVSDPSTITVGKSGVNARGLIDPVLGPIYSYYKYIEKRDDFETDEDSKYVSIAYNHDKFYPEPSIEDFWGNGVLLFTLWNPEEEYVRPYKAQQSAYVGSVSVSPDSFISAYSAQAPLTVSFLGRGFAGQIVDVYVTPDGGVTRYGATQATGVPYSDPYGLIDASGTTTFSIPSIPPGIYSVVAEIGGSGATCGLTVLSDIEDYLSDATAAYDSTVTYTIESRRLYLQAMADARAVAAAPESTYAQILAAVDTATSAAKCLKPYLNPDMGEEGLIDYIALWDMINFSQFHWVDNTYTPVPSKANMEILMNGLSTNHYEIRPAASRTAAGLPSSDQTFTHPYDTRASITMDFGVGMGVILSKAEIQARASFGARTNGVLIRSSANGGWGSSNWINLTAGCANNTNLQTPALLSEHAGNAYRFIRVVNPNGTDANANNFISLAQYRIYGDIVQIPYESVTTGFIADTFVSLDPISEGASRLKMPGVLGYTVGIESSSDESVIQLDGTINTPVGNPEITLVLKFTKTDNPGDFALTGPIKVVVPGTEPSVIDLDVSVSAPTIVASLAAYLNIMAADAPEGVALRAYLKVGDELLHETSVVNGAGRMYIPAAPESGTYELVVIGDGYGGSCEIKVLPYNTNIWAANAYLLDGRLLIGFNDDIILKSGTKCVSIGSASYNAKVLDDKRTVEVLGLDAAALESGTTASVKGIKYPVLFPSYSFTFTVTVP